MFDNSWVDNPFLRPLTEGTKYNMIHLKSGVAVLADANGNAYRVSSQKDAARKAAEVRASGFDSEATTMAASGGLSGHYVQLPKYLKD